MNKPAPMQLSAEGLVLLKSIEKCRLKPYDDQTGCTIANWLPGATIGYGHLIPKESWSLYRSGITESTAEGLLQDYLRVSYKLIARGVTRKLTQNEFDALVLLVYNIGMGNFRDSSVLEHLNTGTSRYPSLELAWKAWDKSQGKQMTGLINRRQCEWNVFSAGIYKSW